jgi:isoleucyl-tRNA synthetase
VSTPCAGISWPGCRPNWNTYGFFVLYARLDDVDFTQDIPPADRPEIDRWALALLNKTIRDCTAALEDYDAKSAGDAIESLVDQLSNWYVRRNRRRFWKSTDPEDKRSAYLTLYECLNVAHKLMAPFVPFLAEDVYQNLVRTVDENAPISVHMSAWPEVNESYDDESLLHDIGVVQKVVGLARAARGQSGMRTRQPLSRLLVRTPDDAATKALNDHVDQILERDEGLVNYRIKPNLPRLGKERGLGKELPDIRRELEKEDGAAVAGKVARGENVVISIPSGELELTAEDLIIETESAEGYACGADAGYLTALDTTLNEELIREGIARELIRTVQESRKQAGLEVSDRIVLGVSGSDGVETALQEFQKYLMSETLATEWQVGQNDPLFSENRTLDQEEWMIEITKI